METEVDKDDKVLTGFKVNLMLCFPWSDQQKWIKKRSTANRGKVLLSGTSLLIISFTSTLENKKHYRALSQTEDKLSSWSCEQVHSSQEYTHPNLHVIWALVILLVEDLKVVLSGWDQAEDGNRELLYIWPCGQLNISATRRRIFCLLVTKKFEYSIRLWLKKYSRQ